MSQRDRLPVEAFLSASGWSGASLTWLPADASYRRYARLLQPEGGYTAILMDAPPERESVLPWVGMARHLKEMGLSAPFVASVDEYNGYALIEDLGEDTFTHLLDQGEHPEPLYSAAIDVLVALQRHPNATGLKLPAFDRAAMLAEPTLLTEWFMPAAGLLGSPLPWEEVLDRLPPIQPTLMLRDFHVDNLLWLPKREGVARVGLLDFQDAMLGPPAYDLVSLLQDARRDVPSDLEAAMLERYRAAAGIEDWDGFMTGYWVMGALRHARVLGLWVRLDWRDGKPAYRKRHLLRTVRLLATALAREPILQPVALALGQRGAWERAAMRLAVS